MIPFRMAIELLRGAECALWDSAEHYREHDSPYCAESREKLASHIGRFLKERCICGELRINEHCIVHGRSWNVEDDVRERGKKVDSQKEEDFIDRHERAKSELSAECFNRIVNDLNAKFVNEDGEPIQNVTEYDFCEAVLDQLQQLFTLVEYMAAHPKEKIAITKGSCTQAIEQLRKKFL